MAEAAPAFTAFIDPDDERFLHPGDLPAHVRAFCAETGQAAPGEPGTLFRVIFESLALRYAAVLDMLGAASGTTPDGVHIVGGGSNNALLNRLTAGATGLPVRAGPVGRELVASSFPMTTHEPEGDWSEARARFAAVTGR
jgi:rhamnulokinase